jgi:hypothetical protein
MPEYLLKNHWNAANRDHLLQVARREYISKAPEGVVYLLAPKPGKLNLSYTPVKGATIIMEIRYVGDTRTRTVPPVK